MSILKNIFKANSEGSPESVDNSLPSQWKMPVSGDVISLSELPDQVFAQGMMGAGFAIKANEKKICSPVNGKIASIFPGGHAIAIVADNGSELLIHVGIDSVGLKGAGFNVLADDGAAIKIGDPLVEVDFDFLDEKLANSSVIMVFPEIDEGEIVIKNEQLTRKL